MKYGKNLLAMAMAGTLLMGALAGCGGDGKEPNPSAPPSSGAPQGEPSEDIAMRTANIARDEILLTVDGFEVHTEEYLYWLASSIEYQQQMGALADEAAWTGNIEDVAAADYLKDDALTGTKTYAIIRSKAAEEGIALTAEQTAELDAQIAQLSATFEAQNLTLQHSLDTRAISQAGFREMSTVYYLNQGLQEKLFPLEEVPAPTDVDMADFLEENGVYNVKHILFATKEQNGDGSTTEFSAEKKAEVKKEAEDVLAKLQAETDPTALFDQIMNERSDDGRNPDGSLAAPDGYLSYPGQMVPEFETASQALAVGEISDLVESDFGYHIILRLDADTEEARSIYTQTKTEEAMLLQQTKMSEQLEKWVEEAKVELSPAYETIQPKSYYDNLQEVIEERQAMFEAATAPTQTPAPEEDGAPAPSASTAPATP